jgi:hypothetical protein
MTSTAAIIKRGMIEERPLLLARPNENDMSFTPLLFIVYSQVTGTFLQLTKRQSPLDL